MRKLSLLSVVLGVLVALPAQATVYQIDISPASGALNLGSTTYTQDHAVGLSALNETSPTASTATGNELGSGIFFDDVSNLLTFDFGYGSAFGFVDLGSNFNGGVHIHGSGAVNYPSANTSAGVQINLGSSHTASGTLSGRITGTTTLLAAQETQLFDNLLYFNIHSTGVPGGEIRGQLVPVANVPEPASLVLSATALLGLPLLLRRRRR